MDITRIGMLAVKALPPNTANKFVSIIEGIVAKQTDYKTVHVPNAVTSDLVGEYVSRRKYYLETYTPTRSDVGLVDIYMSPSPNSHSVMLSGMLHKEIYLKMGRVGRCYLSKVYTNPQQLYDAVYSLSIIRYGMLYLKSPGVLMYTFFSRSSTELFSNETELTEEQVIEQCPAVCIMKLCGSKLFHGVSGYDKLKKYHETEQKFIDSIIELERQKDQTRSLSQPIAGVNIRKVYVDPDFMNHNGVCVLCNTLRPFSQLSLCGHGTCVECHVLSGDVACGECGKIFAAVECGDEYVKSMVSMVDLQKRI
jgi:hypothetical protein